MLRYQWLVKPCASPSSSSSPKRLHSGELKEEEERGAGMEVVELADIKRDLLLSQARLRLTQSAGGQEGSLPAGPGQSNAVSWQKPVFRIRISLNADPDPEFYLHADPDPNTGFWIAESRS